VPDRHSLPPMEAVEFAIGKAFRHCLFALGLLIGWAVLLLPITAMAWFVAFRDGPPDFNALPPAALATLGALGIATLLASLSMGVNWNRRILLDERPRLQQRWRLDRAMWRYAAGVLLLLVVLAVYVAIGFALMTFAVPPLTSSLGAAAKPVGIIVTVLVGLSALFTLYRLMSWLPGLATGEEDRSLGTAWDATKRNRFAFLAFTAFFAQQSLPQPSVKPLAFAFIAAVGWLAVLMVHAVPAALHRAFR